MDRTFLAALVILFLFVLLGLMVLGWQRRKSRQRDLVAPDRAPSELPDAVTFVGKYVATTTAGNPLDRIAVHGLGFRGPASVSVTGPGLLIGLPNSETWIAWDNVRDVRRATWTIDRVVEPDGMTLIEWTLGERVLDTYLRMDDVTAFDRALPALTERQK